MTDEKKEAVKAGEMEAHSFSDKSESHISNEKSHDSLINKGQFLFKKLKLKKKSFLFIFLAGFFCFFIIKSLFFSKTSTLLLSDIEEYNEKLKGYSMFLYYEFAPAEFSELSLNKDMPEEGRRYKEGEVIMPLNDELKEKMRDFVLANPNSPYADYYRDMIDGDNLLMPFSGLLFSSRDGYESLLRPQILDDLSFDDFTDPEFQIDQSQGLRFIDNRIFYLAVRAENEKSLENWTLDNEYEIRMDKDIVLRGRLDRINKIEKGPGLLIFSLHDGIGQVINKRFNKLDIIKKTYKAFRIPIEACFNEDDKIFCFIQNADNIIEKIKVHVLDADNKNGEFIVEAQSKADEDQKNYLKQYDRLILRADKVKEDEIFK